MYLLESTRGYAYEGSLQVGRRFVTVSFFHLQTPPTLNFYQPLNQRENGKGKEDRVNFVYTDSSVILVSDITDIDVDIVCRVTGGRR